MSAETKLLPDKLQIHPLDRACVHFTGTQNKVCASGVAYADVRDNRTKEEGWKMETAWPCLPNGAPNVQCAKRQYATEEQATAAARERDRVFVEFANRSRRGICECGTTSTSVRQVGRCIYFEPCGHRVGQGDAKVYWTGVQAARKELAP